MKKTIYQKNDFVKFRIDGIEKKRLEKLGMLTRRKQCDLYRESMYYFIKERFPELLVS